jgi:NADPH:quinone reductase-like Zn-dependent oxidoreductase
MALRAAIRRWCRRSRFFARNLSIRGAALTAIASDDKQLAELKRFVSDGLGDGSLSPSIARTFPFDEIAEAHRFLEAGTQIGKIVVRV